MDIKIIHTKGIDELNEKQKQIVNRLLNEYYKRIQRQLKNFTSLQFQVKKYEKAGKEKKAKKFSIHIKAIAPTMIFEGDASDWDLARAIHKALNKIINEIEHQLHSSDQHLKIRRPQKRNLRNK